MRFEDFIRKKLVMKKKPDSNMAKALMKLGEIRLDNVGKLTTTPSKTLSTTPEIQTSNNPSLSFNFIQALPLLILIRPAPVETFSSYESNNFEIPHDKDNEENKKIKGSHNQVIKPKRIISRPSLFAMDKPIYKGFSKKSEDNSYITIKNRTFSEECCKSSGNFRIIDLKQKNILGLKCKRHVAQWTEHLSDSGEDAGSNSFPLGLKFPPQASMDYNKKYTEEDLKVDFQIIAVASLNFVSKYSSDKRTMLSDLARKVYAIVNKINGLRTPELLEYEKFKEWYLK